MERKWFLETWFIAILFALWWLYGLPLLLGIVLLVLRRKQDRRNYTIYQETENKLQEALAKNEKIGLNKYEDVMKEIDQVRKNFVYEKELLQNEVDHLKQNRDTEKKKILEEANKDLDVIKKSIDEKSKEIATFNNIIDERKSLINELNESIDKLKQTESRQSRQIETQKKKISRIKELYKSIQYCIDNFLEYAPSPSSIKLKSTEEEEINELSPSVILKLHSMDVKELRKAFKENDKQINTLLEQYSSRYTTKANIAIYKLMVIALRSELQNILYNLKYEKLNDCIDQIKSVTSKYLDIAGNGNQSIAGTLTKFIGEIEYLFINAIKIEYNYYIKKEQAKQEQKALREQMRQEAAERKALEEERRRIEKEELKFNTEIQKLNDQLESSSGSELDLLKSRILELQSQLSAVIVKKEEITTLAQGKAGNVYIISNVGSFGEDVFKIGMTRRLEPQDRVDELGSASVPFKFDVHSFIFSDDAVGLEHKLHEMLNEKRVNKVNMRKEFFKIDIDELENIVSNIDPTAEFRKTILAEEYRQSLTEEEINNSSLLSSATA